MDLKQRIEAELEAILIDCADDESIENRVTTYMQYLETDHFDGIPVWIHDSVYHITDQGNNIFEVKIEYRTDFTSPIEQVIVTTPPPNGAGVSSGPVRRTLSTKQQP